MATSEYKNAGLPFRGRRSQHNLGGGEANIIV